MDDAPCPRARGAPPPSGRSSRAAGRCRARTCAVGRGRRERATSRHAAPTGIASRAARSSDGTPGERRGVVRARPRRSPRSRRRGSRRARRTARTAPSCSTATTRALVSMRTPAAVAAAPEPVDERLPAAVEVEDVGRRARAGAGGARRRRSCDPDRRHRWRRGRARRRGARVSGCRTAPASQSATLTPSSGAGSMRPIVASRRAVSSLRGEAEETRRHQRDEAARQGVQHAAVEARSAPLADGVLPDVRHAQLAEHPAPRPPHGRARAARGSGGPRRAPSSAPARRGPTPSRTPSPRAPPARPAPPPPAPRPRPPRRRRVQSAKCSYPS